MEEEKDNKLAEEQLDEANGGRRIANLNELLYK